MLGAGVLLAALAVASSSSSSASSGGIADDGRPIIVIGDSYAVGIAAALRSLYPGRSIMSLAVGGTSSSSMHVAPDEHVFVIVSAGTNDVGVQPATERTVANILRVLGPYARGEADKGKLFYVLPHIKMGGGLGARVEGLLELLAPRLHASDRFRFGPIRPAPAASDHIHFDMDGYRTIASDAMQALTGGGVTLPSSSSSSGLRADGSLDPAFRARADEVAQANGIPLAMLLAVMNFETAGTMRADIRNPMSAYVGLIQFGKQAASIVGTTQEALARMTAVEQLHYVDLYFQRFGSFAARDPRDAYLAVFAPAGMGKPDAAPLYVAPTAAYEQNKALDKNGDGTIDVGEVRRAIEGSLAQVHAKGWA